MLRRLWTSYVLQTVHRYSLSSINIDNYIYRNYNRYVNILLKKGERGDVIVLFGRKKKIQDEQDSVQIICDAILNTVGQILNTTGNIAIESLKIQLKKYYMELAAYVEERKSISQERQQLLNMLTELDKKYLEIINDKKIDLKKLELLRKVREPYLKMLEASNVWLENNQIPVPKIPLTTKKISSNTDVM